MSPQEDLEGAPLVAKKNRETAQVHVGDKVVLEVLSYDPSEGQIICRTR